MTLRAAAIGDPDLDFDVTTTLQPVVRYELHGIYELLLEGRGGVGAWRNPLTERELHDVDRVESVSIAAGFVLDGPDDVVRCLTAMLDRLIAWSDDHAIVRILAAPEKVTTILGPGDPVYVARS